VFVEGNSFASFVDVDFFVMVQRAGEQKIKKSAKQVLDRADAIYVSGEHDLMKLIERIRCLGNCRETEGAGSGVA
jgi:ketopantoate hydroxymethyltransferase